MASDALDGLKVAILATDGFDQVEGPALRTALDAAGAKVLAADVPLAGAVLSDFDALLTPGGVINPDKLRLLPQAVALAKAFVHAGRPASLWCGPWTVSEAAGPSEPWRRAAE